MADQDYTATLLTFTISGNGGPAGRQDGRLPRGGHQRSERPLHGHRGLRLERRGHAREDGISASSLPARPTIKSSRTSQQDYKSSEVTFTISGSAGVPGIVMKGLPGNPVTGARRPLQRRGPLRIQQLKVTPTKEGCICSRPSSASIEMVVEPQPNQDYSVQVLTYEISGSTGMPGVAHEGFPPGHRDRRKRILPSDGDPWLDGQGDSREARLDVHAPVPAVHEGGRIVRESELRRGASST